jgi:fructose-1,6-bisphosphatase/inositol monophosphatase family enzyme
MTKKLEEEFGLPPLEDVLPDVQENANDTAFNAVATIDEVQEAISISEKIDNALAEVRGMEVHDSEMDAIAVEAMQSYQQLMSLGMNMTDMAAGQVFNNAANMLKIALEAKDSKVSRKLKQVDLMLKKARVDQTAKKLGDSDAEEINSTTFDRNELLKMLGKSDK